MNIGELPGLGDIVHIEPDIAPFRVISVRPAAPGWLYLTGWPLDADPVEQTSYLELSRVVMVERA